MDDTIVEKFIAKCSPEYKVPGLYVIDAIVRQSQYFYREKDVYGPRFLRNLVPVFISLINCNEKDKPMLMRMLYLWQKSSVFPDEVIKALCGVISDPKNPQVVGKVPSQATEIPPTVDNCVSRDDNAVSASEIASDCAQRNTSAKVQLLQLQALQKKIAEQSALLNQEQTIDPEVLTQIHILMSELTRRAEAATVQLANEQANEDLK
ncbi:unnamed protein product [Schistosoma mattheei]|uniref:Uncharacterized protein n=1 Tax=Schistosoma mattheei TaxID=31246 RepID=A0A183PM40_9TREM|nr:unnamed protein product [Schistosoma mattheei]